MPVAWNLLLAAQARDETPAFLQGAASYLGHLLLPDPLAAALEVEDAGAAHGHGAGVGDCRRGGPSSHGYELHRLAAQGPEAEARGQNTDEFPCPLHGEFFTEGGGDVEHHPRLVGRHYRHVGPGDGQGPYHGVLAGVVACDLFAHGPPERRGALCGRAHKKLIPPPYDNPPPGPYPLL